MKGHDPIMSPKQNWYSACNGQAYANSIGMGYPNEGILAPHIEAQDAWKNREKVLNYLNRNLGKKGLIPIKQIAEELKLTEQFITQALEDYGMEIIEE